jgi:hypothetical protein
MGVFSSLSRQQKESGGYTSENIILHNFLLSIISLAVIVTIALMSYKTNPLKIVSMKGKACSGPIPKGTH